MTLRSQIDYQVAGPADRPALTLLHAGGMTHREWEPHLEAWSRRFRLIAVTAPGHGASERVRDLDFDVMTDRVLELLDHLGVPRSHFLGSSMGGVTSLRLALRDPDRVDRLVLYRSNYRTEESTREELARMVEPETWQRWGLDGFMREAHRPQGGPQAWIDVTRRVIELVDPTRTASMLPAEELRKVRARTLIISGDRDPVVPLQDALRMHAEIPDSSLWIVPGATHVLGFEGWRREAFEREIIHFLTRP